MNINFLVITFSNAYLVFHQDTTKEIKIGFFSFNYIEMAERLVRTGTL
jgi:hypothetical protein